MKKNRTISITRLFLNHLIGLSFAIITLILVMILLAAFAMRTGLVLQANYVESRLIQLEETYSKNFDKSLLPPYCSYVLLDETDGLIDSDMGKHDLEKTRTYLVSGNKSYYDSYKIISQINGNLIVIKYDILVHFNNPILNKIIPYPEFTILIVLLGLIVLLAVITATKFSKKLKKNLIPIVAATEKIEAQDLDFEVEPTKISEFNSTLDAIDKLKNALATSLNEKWDKEQQRQSELSALAHDIKTPLTIIKGNADLLAEEEYSKENKELISYIQLSSNTIEKYLDLFISVVNNKSLSFHPESVRLHDFIEEFTTSALPLCNMKNIYLHVQNNTNCEFINVDRELLKRAIINVLDNACRYSQNDSQIDVMVSEKETHIIFEVNDYGKGFTDESLKKATQEFYTEDTARTNHNYGLGLSFTKNVAELHNGILVIENHIGREGAMVSIQVEKY